jgi:hypothetical protein
MKEVSPQCKRFQQIKNHERQVAIERAKRQAVENAGKDKIRQANPTLTDSQLNAVYRRAEEIQERNARKG